MEITRELYDFLESRETLEIKNIIYASIVYLKKARKQDVKKIIFAFRIFYYLIVIIFF